MAYLTKSINQRAHEAMGKQFGAINEPVTEVNGIRVEKSVIINKGRKELYRFWRNFENLPHIMNHLEEVRVINPVRSHWVAKAPAGTTVEWDAEITHDHENELIAWSSIEGSKVPNAGTVRFLHFAEGQTEVRVSLEYDPPGGRLGDWIAGLLGEKPEQQITEDLARFKQIMEIESKSADEIDTDQEVI